MSNGAYSTNRLCYVRHSHAKNTPPAKQQLLQGSDIVACAHTGSGKTLAYLLPALHNILTNTLGRAGWQALILVPTRELVQQVTDEATHLASHIDGDLRITALASTTQPSTAALQRAAVSTAGQVVVATPGRVAQALHDGSLTARVLSTRLHTLVLDEADLLMSYGYEEDIAALAPLVPRACQCILVSATTNEDMQRLTKLVLHNPTMLDLRGVGGGAQGGGEEHKGGPAIVHHAVECVAGDRLLVLMAMLKLGLVRYDLCFGCVCEGVLCVGWEVHLYTVGMLLGCCFCLCLCATSLCTSINQPNIHTSQQ